MKTYDILDEIMTHIETDDSFQGFVYNKFKCRVERGKRSRNTRRSSGEHLKLLVETPEDWDAKEMMTGDVSLFVIDTGIGEESVNSQCINRPLQIEIVAFTTHKDRDFYDLKDQLRIVLHGYDAGYSNNITVETGENIDIDTHWGCVYTVSVDQRLSTINDKETS